MASTSSPARRVPRAVRIGLVVAAALVALPAIALPVIAWAFDVGGLVRKQVLALKPAWEQEIGREIAIGAVSVRLFPTLAVAIHDVAVRPEATRAAAGGASAESLFNVGELRVEVAMWRLITSLGKDIGIRAVEVHHPSINVVRFADGTLSYADIVERTADKPASKPLTPEQLEYLDGIHLARASITAASLHFTEMGDGGTPVTYIVEDLDVIARDARLGMPFSVTIDAAVLSTARNFHLALGVGAVPRDLVITAPGALLERAELKLAPVEIEPLLKFLPPPQGVSLRKALAEADLSLEMPPRAGKIKLKGSVAAKQLVLVAPPRGKALPISGQPTDVSLKMDLAADPVAGDLSLDSFALAVGAMGVSGKIDVRSAYSRPQISALAIATQGVTFERITAVLPPGELPPGAALAGPLSLSASASGSPESAEVNAALDLDGASIVVPKALRKPAGVPLRAEFRGRVQPAVVDVSRLALVLGALAVAVHGTVQPRGDFDLQLDSIKAQIDPLLRLLPGVESAIPHGTSVAGDLALAGHVRKTGKTLDGDIKIELAGAAVKTSALELLGGATASIKMRAAGQNAQAADAIDAVVDLGPARLFVPGKIDKAAGVPMRVVLGADRAGERLTVRELTVDVPGADLHAAGVSDGARLDLKVSRCDLDLAKLAAVMPLLRDKDTLPPWLADAHLQFTAALDGDPARLGTVHARLDNLDLAAASGHVKGFADVVGLDEPKKIAFELAGTGLDFDRILGPGGGAPAGPVPANLGARPAPVVPRFVKTLALDGKLSLDKGRIHGAQFANLAGVLAMQQGRGEFKTLHLDIFGGSLIADGSTIDVNPNPPSFSLHTRLQNIHLGQVIAFESPALGQRCDGHGNVDVNVEGHGLTWEQIAPQLAGQVGLALADGRIMTTSIGGSALNQLFSRVPGLAAAPVTGNEVPLRDLATHFHIADGQLRTTEPIALQTGQGPITLAGAIGLDQRLALTGTMAIPAAVIAGASGGRLKMNGPLPVSLRVGGTITAPQIEVVDLVRTAGVLAASLLQSQGQQVLEGALGKQLGGQIGGAAGKVLGAGSVDAAAAEAQRQIQAEAQKRLQDEQAKVQQQIQQRLQQEAQKRLQQEAQQRLQDEAKKRLGGLGGLLGN